MGKKRKPQDRPVDPRESGSGQAGAPMDPSEAPAQTTDQPCGVPIGLPLSDEEYEKLQRRALHHTDPHQAQGQEDSSA
jgi:hypothetical protein